VYGDSLHNYLVAVIVPEKEALSKFGDNDEALNEDKVKNSFIEELKKIAKQEGFHGFEVP